jgi:hypothetical protein
MARTPLADTVPPMLPDESVSHWYRRVDTMPKRCTGCHLPIRKGGAWQSTLDPHRTGFLHVKCWRQAVARDLFHALISR